MAQVKIYGQRGHLERNRDRLSETIHSVNQQILGLPAEKRFHRFIGLDAKDFFYPADRSPAYTIIEISLFEGRSDETLSALLKGLVAAIADKVGLEWNDVEITLFETPRRHWAIRGGTADALDLPYDVSR